MARMLEQFPDVVDRGDTKYPWSEWANGHPWELEAGKDFDTKINSFRQTCAKLAQRRSLKFRSAVRREGGKELLIVQFTDETKTPGRRRATRTS
jgi:hypothetical protein